MVEAPIRGKEIYMISDGSGRTAEHSVNTVLGQFEHFLVDRGCPVNTRLFSRINDVERLMEIIMQAAKEDVILIYTLADEKMVVSARHTCVSRSGKTPLSIYLAQKGFKVANVPIVKGVVLPKALFEIDPKKVFALTINPVMLQIIRRTRAKSLEFVEEEGSNYAEMAHVREELHYADKIFEQNPAWPIIEVTGKAIEEIVVIILRLYQDRKHRCTMPRISKLY